jgi:transketolase
MRLHEQDLQVVYAQTLGELMAKDPRVVCLEADLALASSTIPVISEKYPERFFDTGVSEANMIGLAAGLALEGKIPFCSTFTCFSTRRVYDQITISVAYPNNNVKIIGTAPGVTQGSNGGTHMCFLDLALMRAMPNMHLYSPCDAYELRSVLRYTASTRQPTYVQVIRFRVPAVFDDDYVFDPDHARVLRQGDDVTLVTTGYMAPFVLRAAGELAEQGIRAEVLHYPSVKPFDAETLVASARKTGGVVTVENQSIIGGLGGAVCEVLSERHPVRIKRLGVPDQFGEVATEDYLFHKHGFGVSHIVAAAQSLASCRGKPEPALASRKAG